MDNRREAEYTIHSTSWNTPVLGLASSKIGGKEEGRGHFIQRIYSFWFCIVLYRKTYPRSPFRYPVGEHITDQPATNEPTRPQITTTPTKGLECKGTLIAPITRPVTYAANPMITGQDGSVSPVVASQSSNHHDRRSPTPIPPCAFRSAAS